MDKFPPVKYILTNLYEIFCTALFNMHFCICYDVSRVVHELVELVSKQSFVWSFPPYFLDVDLPFFDLILLLFCFYILLYKSLPFCLVLKRRKGKDDQTNICYLLDRMMVVFRFFTFHTFGFIYFYCNYVFFCVVKKTKVKGVPKSLHYSMCEATFSVQVATPKCDRCT